MQQNTTDDDTLAFGIDELVRRGPLGRTFIFAEIRAGRLRARKAGRRTIVLRADYVEYLTNLPAVDALGDDCQGREAD